MLPLRLVYLEIQNEKKNKANHFKSNPFITLHIASIKLFNYSKIRKPYAVVDRDAELFPVPNIGAMWFSGSSAARDTVVIFTMGFGLAGALSFAPGKMVVSLFVSNGGSTLFWTSTLFAFTFDAESSSFSMFGTQ